MISSSLYPDVNKTRKIGYGGSKRYSRLTITPAANVADARLLAAVVVPPIVIPQPKVDGRQPMDSRLEPLLAHFFIAVWLQFR